MNAALDLRVRPFTIFLPELSDRKKRVNKNLGLAAAFVDECDKLFYYAYDPCGSLVGL